MGDKDSIQCPECKTIYNKFFLMGKQGNTDTCPMCGAQMQKTEEEDHPDWITWYYYQDEETKCFTLRDKAIDLEKWTDTKLIKEFKAPPESECGLDEVKRILRTYIPDAFVYKQAPEDVVQCPYCLSKEVQLVPRKFSLLTGFAINKFDRMCIRCKRKF